MPTPRHSLPYLVQSQAQKEITHNEALNLIDLTLHCAVLDRDRVAPPAAPAQGDCHLVAEGATGAWAGCAGQIAAWIGTAWAFVAPLDGMLVFVVGEGRFLVFHGDWGMLAGAGGIEIGDVAGLAATLDDKLDAGDAAGFATAAQGLRAETAVQPGDLGTAALLDAGVAGGLATLDGGGRVPAAQLPEAILGAMRFEGLWNAATNSPAIPAAGAGNLGWFYIVATAGATAVDGIGDWQLGDWIVSTGDAWRKIDGSDQVTAVAGLAGNISAAALRSALGLVVGSSVQAQSAKLQALADLAWAADKGLCLAGAGSIASFDLSSYMRGVMASASSAALLAAIGALPLAGGTVAGALMVTGPAGMSGNSPIPDWSSMSLRSLLGVMSYSPGAAFAGNLYYSDVWRYAKNGFGFVMGTDGSGNFTIALAPANAAGAGAAATPVTQAIVYADGSIGTALPTGALKLNGQNVVTAERLLLARPLAIASLSGVALVNGALAFCTDLGGGSGPVYCNGVKWIRLNQSGVATMAGDADVTLTYLSDAPTQVHAGTLTANRAITLSPTNAVNGARFRVCRTGGGTFGLSVGGLKSLATNTWCEVEHNGTAWVLTGYGSL